MKEFLTIQEVAEWLGVSDKTVSRLILSAQLPATKVGGLYRLREADIQEYLEKQQLRLQSRTRSGGDPAVHASVESAPGPGSAGSSCSRCGRLIKGATGLAGECQSPDCHLPLCRLCWGNEYDRYCRQHRPTQEQKLATARHRLSRGEIPVLVTAEEAREKEFLFTQRFHQKIRESPYLIGPLDGVKYPVSSWDEILLRSQELNQERMNTLRLTRPDLDLSLLPQNPTSCYNRARQSGRTDRRGATFSICASVVLDLEEMAANGFCTSPATRAGLLKVLEEKAAANKSVDSFTVLGLASATGWAKEAREMIEGGTATASFSSLYVAICLIDLATSRLFFNPLDARLKPFIPLFLGQLSYETVHKIAEWVRQYLSEGQTITTFKEIAEKLGTEESLVKEACVLLEKEGGFAIDMVPQFGLTISRT